MTFIFLVVLAVMAVGTVVSLPKSRKRAQAILERQRRLTDNDPDLIKAIGIRDAAIYGIFWGCAPAVLFTVGALLFFSKPLEAVALFFLFMVFAALSTVLGVCENILAMVRELTGWSRPKGCVVCGVGIFLLALTTALGYSVLHFQPFAPGSAWLDFWDFIVSNNVLPLGSLVLALFCCNRFGWGWDNFVAEANTGRGLKVCP